MGFVYYLPLNERFSLRCVFDGFTDGAWRTGGWEERDALLAFGLGRGESSKLVGINKNEFGRFNCGAPMGAVTWESGIEMFNVQVPRIVSAAFVGRDSSKPLFAFPMAVFGIVVTSDDSNLRGWKGQENVCERQLLVYNNKLLLAERNIDAQGIPSDCCAQSWHDALYVAESVLKDSLESGYLNFKTSSIGYYTFPSELIAATATLEGGEMRKCIQMPDGFDPIDFYELANYIALHGVE